MVQKYELANGSFVDRETYVKGYKMLHTSFLALEKLVNCLEDIKQQRSELLKGYMAAKEEGPETVKRNLETVKSLQQEMEEKLELLKNINELFLEHRDKLLPKCYHNDKAVLTISYLVSSGKAHDLKEALAVYHELMHREEARDIYNSLDPYAKEAIAERERKKAAREKEMLDLDREIRDLQSLTSTFHAQAAQSQRRAESSMTSAESSYNYRKLTEK